MQYTVFLAEIANYVPRMFKGTLPSPRYDYYADTNFSKVQRAVMDELNRIDNALGFFNMQSHPVLIAGLLNYQTFYMFTGLIFNVLLIIFTIVATLLVFSLLLISVESKTSELGVLRLVGLTNHSFIGFAVT